METKTVETERCVGCGAETDVPVTRHVALRPHYVEGAGQLCPTCWKATYPQQRAPTR